MTSSGNHTVDFLILSVSNYPLNDMLIRLSCKTKTKTKLLLVLISNIYTCFLRCMDNMLIREHLLVWYSEGQMS